MENRTWFLLSATGLRSLRQVDIVSGKISDFKTIGTAMNCDCLCIGVLVGLLSGASASAASEGGETPASFPALSVWDTGVKSAEPLSVTTVRTRSGWTRLERAAKSQASVGDTVLANDRILAVCRRQSPLIELYTLGQAGPQSRVQLLLVSGDAEPAVRMQDLKVADISRSSARLEVIYQTARGNALAATLRLKRGAVAIELQAGTGSASVRVVCPSRVVILPDFFADDIVIDPRKIPPALIDLPSENFLLHLTGRGDCIAMCVFESPEHEVSVSLAGENQQRLVAGSQIHFGAGADGAPGKVWLALLETPDIWHEVTVRLQDTNKIMPLDWKMPFEGQWRVDFTRTNELTDSWEMLLEDPGRTGYLKPTWLGRGANHLPGNRKRWTTVLGWFHYPCWIDATGRGYLQPLKNRSLAFEGPAVLYPINRTERTPTDLFTVVDVVRNSLGVGPCEYVLNVEGQKQQYRGRATCGARDALLEIYQKNQQRQKRRQVEEALDDALAFVTHIRSRISAYVEFGHEIRRYLAEQQKQHPDLQKFLTEMDDIAAELDRRMARRKERIHNPEFVAAMNADFRRDLLDYEGTDVMERVKRYTTQLTQIGGNQDELVGECRWVVRSLRQRAALAMALDPRVADIAREIRARTQKVLLKPATYEAARH